MTTVSVDADLVHEAYLALVEIGAHDLARAMAESLRAAGYVPDRPVQPKQSSINGAPQPGQVWAPSTRAPGSGRPAGHRLVLAVSRYGKGTVYSRPKLGASSLQGWSADRWSEWVTRHRATVVRESSP